MLRITIDEEELFDEKEGTFQTVGGVVLDFEHSLFSMSKWESKYQKPFLTDDTKTSEEVMDYLGFMVVTKNWDPGVLYRVSSQNIREIKNYIDSRQSATTFGEMPERRGPSETITSELIYYWMVSFNIPFECQYWHLNRLLSLVRVCNLKNSPPKKMSRHEIAQRNREINAKRKAELGTSG